MKKVFSLITLLIFMSFTLFACKENSSYKLNADNNIFTIENYEINEKIKYNTEVKITIKVPEGKELSKLLIDNEDKTSLVIKNTFVYTITNKHELKAEFIDKTKDNLKLVIPTDIPGLKVIEPKVIDLNNVKKGTEIKLGFENDTDKNNFLNTKRLLNIKKNGVDSITNLSGTTFTFKMDVDTEIKYITKDRVNKLITFENNTDTIKIVEPYEEDIFIKKQNSSSFKTYIVDNDFEYEFKINVPQDKMVDKILLDGEEISSTEMARFTEFGKFKIKISKDEHKLNVAFVPKIKTHKIILPDKVEFVNKDSIKFNHVEENKWCDFKVIAETGKAVISLKVDGKDYINFLNRENNIFSIFVTTSHKIEVKFGDAPSKDKKYVLSNDSNNVANIIKNGSLIFKDHPMNTLIEFEIDDTKIEKDKYLDRIELDKIVLHKRANGKYQFYLNKPTTIRVLTHANPSFAVDKNGNITLINQNNIKYDLTQAITLTVGSKVYTPDELKSNLYFKIGSLLNIKIDLTKGKFDLITPEFTLDKLFNKYTGEELRQISTTEYELIIKSDFELFVSLKRKSYIRIDKESKQYLKDITPAIPDGIFELIKEGSFTFKIDETAIPANKDYLIYIDSNYYEKNSSNLYSINLNGQHFIKIKLIDKFIDIRSIITKDDNPNNDTLGLSFDVIVKDNSLNFKHKVTSSYYQFLVEPSSKIFIKPIVTDGKTLKKVKLYKFTFNTLTNKKERELITELEIKDNVVEINNPTNDYFIEFILN